eukprot:m.318796 g.318796  ORF g.318796 m.318796 type:complete len:87 (+) comp23086_c2_seq39:1637-1897(+)
MLSRRRLPSPTFWTLPRYFLDVLTFILLQLGTWSNRIVYCHCDALTNCPWPLLMSNEPEMREPDVNSQLVFLVCLADLALCWRCCC